MTDEIKKAAVPDDYMAQYDGFTGLWISTSALATLMTCGISFYRKYVLREREPSTIRQTVGSGTHKGRERNLIQKVDSHVDLAVDEVTDATRDAIVDSFDNTEINIEKEFEGTSKENARSLAVDIGTQISTVDRQTFHPVIQPTAVEKSYAVQYPGLSRVIVGKVDVEEDVSILDFKSGKRAYGQDKVDNSMQLSTYGLLRYATTGQLADRYIVHNVTKGKTEAKANCYETTRTVEDLQRQLDRFAAWSKLIDAGDFGPCDPTHWKCSEAWCGFWRTCKYGGGK